MKFNLWAKVFCFVLFVLEPLYEVLELELNKSEYKINGQKVKRVGNINL